MKKKVMYEIKTNDSKRYDLYISNKNARKEQL